jgi:hypothetical protein
LNWYLLSPFSTQSNPSIFNFIVLLASLMGSLVGVFRTMMGVLERVFDLQPEPINSQRVSFVASAEDALPTTSDQSMLDAKVGKSSSADVDVASSGAIELSAWESVHDVAVGVTTNRLASASVAGASGGVIEVSRGAHLAAVESELSRVAQKQHEQDSLNAQQQAKNLQQEAKAREQEMRFREQESINFQQQAQSQRLAAELARLAQLVESLRSQPAVSVAHAVSTPADINVDAFGNQMLSASVHGSLGVADDDSNANPVDELNERAAEMVAEPRVHVDTHGDGYGEMLDDE